MPFKLSDFWLTLNVIHTDKDLFCIVNFITIILEKPYLKDEIVKIRESLSNLISVDINQISIKSIDIKVKNGKINYSINDNINEVY